MTETRIDHRPGRKQPFAIWAKTGAEGETWEVHKFAETIEDAEVIASVIAERGSYTARTKAHH